MRPAEWIIPRMGVADIVGCPVLDVELNTHGKLWVRHVAPQENYVMHAEN